MDFLYIYNSSRKQKIVSWNAFIWKVSVKLIPLGMTEIKVRDGLEILFTRIIKGLMQCLLTQIQRTWTSYWGSGVRVLLNCLHYLLYESISKELIIIIKQWNSIIRQRIPWQVGTGIISQWTLTYILVLRFIDLTYSKLLRICVCMCVGDVYFYIMLGRDPQSLLLFFFDVFILALFSPLISLTYY